MTKKIYTLRDAIRDNRLAKEVREAAVKAPRLPRVFEVVDERGLTVGRCISRKRADAFIRDSLNSSGWAVRS